MDPRPSVVVFDVDETLSDMTPLAARFTDVGAPELLAAVWFSAVLRDGFALAATGGSETFGRLGDGMLRAVLAGAPLNRPVGAAVSHILAGLDDLAVHPDVPAAVRILRGHGLRLIILSNGPADLADRVLRRAGLRDEFEQLLSVDDAGAWKPTATAYAYAAVLGQRRPAAAGRGASMGHPRRTLGGPAHRLGRQAASPLPRLHRPPGPVRRGPGRPGPADRFLISV